MNKAVDLLVNFQHFLSSFPVQANDKLLVAISGGVDSVVLAHLCYRAGRPFALAHCNFQLRGEESDRDEAFVRTLAKEFAVPLFVEKFDTLAFAAAEKLSVQEAARQLRYPFFEKLRGTHGFAFTLLAHHADDNIETLLMNFFRGTGMEGLTGMPLHHPAQANCLRPLLQFRRQQILDYAHQQHLQWVEDSSNLSVKYTRNFFRLQLLPLLKEKFPQVEENLLDNIQRFEKTHQLYKELLRRFKKKFCKVKGNEVHLPVLQLLQYKDSSLIFEIIRDYGFGEKQVDEVLKLAAAPSGKYIANEKYQIIRHRHWLIIAPAVMPATTQVIEAGQELVLFAGGQIRIREYGIEKWKLDPSPAVAQLDAREVEWPLVLRRWKQGDYFYPLGMRKKKKISRFLIDQKLSKIDKENLWVIESHQRIIWVVGHRIDDRFKVSAKTKKLLEISLSSL